MRVLKTHGPAGLARIVMFVIELLAVDLRLRCLPYRFNRELLSDGCAKETPHEGFGTRALIEQLTRQVAIAARFSSRSGDCLRRAIVLRRALQRRGISTRLVYGASRAGPGAGGIRAHAWLEIGGTRVESGGWIRLK